MTLPSESFNTLVGILYKLSFIVIKPSEASEGLQNETRHENKYRLHSRVRSDGGPPHAFKTGHLLSIGSPTAFNFAFIEFDFCQPVICHPYCPHHQFSDSFINCYLSYTRVVYRAMKNTVRIGSEGKKGNGCFPAKVENKMVASHPAEII